MTLLLSWSALSLFLMTPLISHAKTADAPSEPAIAFPETTARQWTLDNGLEVIVQEDHSSPVASVQMWVDTGSIDEDKHMGAGLSHILEHMLFKGTATRPANDIALKIQDSGGYINAYTSFDRTVYWIDIPAKGVPTAVEILSDAMMNSTLPEEEYTKEQEVIRREFAMGYDDPDRMASRKLFETAYATHPYRHPVIGYLDVYNKLTREDVMAYYKKRYTPNNMFFVVTGDVDAEKVHQQIAGIFDKYPRESVEPVYIPAEPPQLGRRNADVEFATELTRLNMAWHVPALTNPDVPALDLASTILGNGRSSRLYRELREGQSLAHEISAWIYAPGAPGLFGVSATLDPDKREATEQAVLAIIEKMKADGVTAEELAKAKKQSLSSQLSSLTTTRGLAGDLGSNWILTRNLDFSREYLEAIQKVTVADIQRVVRKYLVEDQLSSTSLNPMGSLTAKAAAEKPPAAGDVQKFTLPNGLRLLVREDPRLPLVSMVSVFKAGTLAESAQDNGITQLVSNALLKGTTTRSADQIADEIEAVGGSISTTAGNSSIGVAVGVMQPDLKLGLEILSDVLLHPTFPKPQVEREKLVQLASIKAEEEEMTTVARNLMRSALFPNHPYGLRSQGSPESVTALTAEQLQTFHDKYVVGKNGVLAVYGNVKAEEVKAQVEKLFAELPAGEEALASPSVPAPLTESQTVEANKDKAQAIIMIAYRGTDMFNEDLPALELIDEASSDLGSRFFVRIREKLGLAYFVGSSQMPGLVTGPFAFYLGTSPEKADQVLVELRDEISQLAKDGLTDAELARAKEKIIGQQEIRNQSSGAFAFATALDELYGLGYAHYKTDKDRMMAVTAEEVKRVAQKYFLDQPVVTALVRPVVKPAQPEEAESAASPAAQPTN